MIQGAGPSISADFHSPPSAERRSVWSRTCIHRMRFSASGRRGAGADRKRSFV